MKTSVRYDQNTATFIYLFIYFLTQVHYLHNSLNPSDMALSGGGFFRLDMALLVSVNRSTLNNSSQTKN